MSKRVEMTETQIATLTTIVAVMTATMRTVLVAHGLPCDASVTKVLSASLADSLTDSFIHGRLGLDKLN